MSIRVAILGYGNPGRGDDAAGPLLAEQVERLALPGVRVVSDYQLNVEHAADVAEAELAIFIDAAVDAAEPWEFRRLEPEIRNDFTTHAMLPETVLETARNVYGTVPPAYVLALRGENFELGTGLSAEFRSRLRSAAGLLESLLRDEDPVAACNRQVSG